MKKTIAAIVLALGFAGAANADTRYACEMYSAKINGDTTPMLAGISLYEHAATKEKRKFAGLEVSVRDDNSQFSFVDPIQDKTIKSPKLKQVKNSDVEAYNANDKKFLIVFDNNKPMFRYETEKETYVAVNCSKIQ